METFNEPLRVVVITQHDSFVIPKNLYILSKVSNTKIFKVIVQSSKSSLNNKKLHFVKGFGLLQSAKLGIKIAINYFISYLDRLSGFNMLAIPKSIKNVCRKLAIDYEEINDINSAKCISTLEQLSPDLIVSYSAPNVFSQHLLDIPKHGCINLHCSLLPECSGVMPSFWALYKNKKYTGATVHIMDSEIDNGPILMQEKVIIQPKMTMYDVIKETKKVGGQLMCLVVKEITNNSKIVRDNNSIKSEYNSWPTIEQIQEFRRMGHRLI